MQIALFGDSFCCENSGYIAKLADHYKADIVSLGHAASSVWDLLLVQFKKYQEADKYPDVCIFIWTAPGKLYHRKHRNLNIGSVAESGQTKFHPVWRAAKEYYAHLSDAEKEDLEYCACLHYFDTVVLPSIPHTTKIVHLWSFGKIEKFSDTVFDPAIAQYYHTWQTGAEVRPPLACISLLDSCLEEMAGASNHLDTNAKNELVFDMIRQAIDTNNDVDRTSELAEQWIKHPPVKKVITIKTFIKNVIVLFKRNKTDDPFIYL
jgi:hypothetical protein